MSVEPFDPNTISYVRLFPWVRLFRAVGLALDSKKLLLATLGMVLLGLGWGQLDRLFPGSSEITPVVAASAAREPWRGVGPIDSLGQAMSGWPSRRCSSCVRSWPFSRSRSTPGPSSTRCWRPRGARRSGG